MPTTIHTTNFTGETELQSGNDYYLAQGISHVALSGTYAIELQFVGQNNIVIDGSLIAFSTQAIGDSSTTSDNNSITITQSGSVVHNFVGNAIQLAGDDVIVNNAGLISASTAIRFDGDRGQVFNSGTIAGNNTDGLSSASYVVVLGTGTQDFFNTGQVIGHQGISGSGLMRITNSGAITVSDFAIVAQLGGTLRLSNTGTIESLGIFSSSASIQGRSNADLVQNSGTIIGDINLDSGQDTLRNSGDIIGEVRTNNEVFGTGTLLVNSGLIDGDVLFGASNETVFNSGTITGDLDLGGGVNLYDGIGDSLVQGQIIGGDLNDTLRGGDNADRMLGGALQDLIVGRGGDDSLDGEANNDTIFGGSGDDTVIGGAGADSLIGGSGDDIVVGGADNDTLQGNAGNDNLSGGTGTDNLLGGTGDDTLRGGLDNDTLRAGSGNDSLEGEDGTDFLFGGNGNDELKGGADNDFLRGEADNDLLEGGDGVDDLRGGTGDDTLDGGAGLDRLYGGGGADQFLYNGATDSAAGGIDTIYDFDQGTDVLNFEQFAGEFTFVGTAAHAGGGQASIRYIDTAAGVSVRADVDGDGTTDMVITVRDLDAMTADDFIL